ncbi:MAG: stage II sporulation protein M [Alicyclobacillaceae bacterium]|nr:stage II sporulation protein M [Alicyclobacillaceae bacterium]
MNPGWRYAADRYLHRRGRLYRFATVLFLVGVFFGAVVEGSLGGAPKQLLADEVTHFFQAVAAGGGAAPGEILSHAAMVHLKWAGLIGMFGMSVVGLPFLVGLVFLKGFILGFSVGFLVEKYAWKGLLISAAGIVPQNLVAVPALLLSATAGMAFSLQLVRMGLAKPSRGNFRRELLAYGSATVAAAALLMLAAGIEGYVSSWLMRAAVAYAVK